MAREVRGRTWCSRHDGRLADDTIARLADEHRVVPGENGPAFLERLPERSKLGSSSVGLTFAVMRFTWRTPPEALHPLELGERALGRFTLHRQADQPVRCSLAEVE